MTKPKFKFKFPKNSEPVIVQILPSLISGGVERGTVEMAKAIQEAGGRCIVISNGGPLVRHIERCGGRHIELPVNIKNPLRWHSLRRQLRFIFKTESFNFFFINKV